MQLLEFAKDTLLSFVQLNLTLLAAPRVALTAVVVFYSMVFWVVWKESRNRDRVVLTLLFGSVLVYMFIGQIFDV